MQISYIIYPYDEINIFYYMIFPIFLVLKFVMLGLSLIRYQDKIT